MTEESKPLRAQITLKNGVQIEFEVEKLETTRNRLTGAMTEIKWTTPAGWKRKLHTIDPEQIAAIVVIDEEAA